MRNALEQLSFKFSRALFVTKKEFFLCFICFVYVIKSYWNIHDTISLNSILFLNWLNLEDKGTCVWQIIYFNKKIINFKKGSKSSWLWPVKQNVCFLAVCNCIWKKKKKKRLTNSQDMVMLPHLYNVIFNLLLRKRDAAESVPVVFAILISYASLLRWKRKKRT